MSTTPSCASAVTITERTSGSRGGRVARNVAGSAQQADVVADVLSA